MLLIFTASFWAGNAIRKPPCGFFGREPARRIYAQPIDDGGGILDGDLLGREAAIIMHFALDGLSLLPLSPKAS